MTEQKRLMPDPFFVGSALSTTIGHILPRSHRLENERPLVDGERRLGWFVLPPFQRPPVWTREQQIRLIESLWLELPVGVYIYNEGPYMHPTDSWLVDGQQRITSILSYMDDAFPVFGHLWSEVPKVERFAFEMKGLPCVQLKMSDPVQLREIYDRLAYGGTPHDPI